MSRYRHLLDHVEDLLGPVQPHVVVGDGHGLEGDLLRVLEVGVRPPDAVEPLNGQQLEVIIVTAPTHQLMSPPSASAHLVLPRHVGRQPQSVIIPLLPKKYVGHVCLQVTGEIRSLEIID